MYGIYTYTIIYTHANPNKVSAVTRPDEHATIVHARRYIIIILCTYISYYAGTQTTAAIREQIQYVYIHDDARGSPMASAAIVAQSPFDRVAR